MKTKFVGVVLCAAIFAAVPFAARADMDTQRNPHSNADDAMRGDRHNLDEMGRPKKDTGLHMSNTISKIVKSLFDAAGKKDWATAKAKLAEARAISSPTDFDSFELDVVTGFIAVNTGDHPGALASYKKVIANPLFATAQSPAEQTATLKNAMILSNEANDFTGTIALGQKLQAVGPLDDSAAVTLSVAYYGNKDYATAQSLAQKAIDAAVAAGKTPNPTAAQVVAQSKANMH